MKIFRRNIGFIVIVVATSSIFSGCSRTMYGEENKDFSKNDEMVIMVNNSVENNKKEDAIVNLDLNYSVEFLKNDYSIYNAKGQELAEIYYSLPILSYHNMEYVDLINNFYETDNQMWLTDSNRLNNYNENYFQEFLKDFYEIRVNGAPFLNSNDIESIENDISIQPARYIVDSNLVYLDNKYISIVQEKTEQNIGGPSEMDFFGSTFNLETGTMVPFTEFVNINISEDEFEERLIDKIYLAIYEYDYEYDKEILHDMFINDQYNTLNNFKYKYFYDGDNIYFITDNIHLSTSDSLIFKWNMSTSDDMKLELIWSLEDLTCLQ